jgi:hypothetical protein
LIRGDANRYTYNGFLACADCENPLYTHSSKHDFYVCKTRNTRERRRRETEGLAPCGNRYMLRAKLESKIDCLLGEKLRERHFLGHALDAYKSQLEQYSNRRAIDQASIAARLAELKDKKVRVLDAFFEGLVDKFERDRKLTNIQCDVDSYERLLLEAGLERPSTVADLEQVLEPFSEWEFLEREDKRALLAMICPEIKIFQYTVKSLVLRVSVLASGRNNASRSKTGA